MRMPPKRNESESSEMDDGAGNEHETQLGKTAEKLDAPSQKNRVSTPRK